LSIYLNFVNCNVNVLYKIIFSTKLGFILEKSFFLYKVGALPSSERATHIQPSLTFARKTLLHYMDGLLALP
jgi:hypothetical protein